MVRGELRPQGLLIKKSNYSPIRFLFGFICFYKRMIFLWINSHGGNIIFDEIKKETDLNLYLKSYEFFVVIKKGNYFFFRKKKLRIIL